MDDLLQQLQHKINRTHPICVPSVNDKETGSRLCHWSPLADALGSNDPKSGGEWWAILDKLAAEDPGCGAAVGCLVGLALGDACGAPLEFCAVDSRLPDLPAGDFSDLRRPCLSGQLDDTGQLVYQNARNKFDLKLGQWTDDASMALCLADSLLVRGRYDGGDVRVRWHMWWFHGYCNAFRYDAERRKGRGSVGLGGNVAKSLQEIERTLAASRTQHVQSTPLLIENCHDPDPQGSVQIAQSSGRLQKNASHASVVPPIYQSSSNDSGNGFLASAETSISRSYNSAAVVGSNPRVLERSTHGSGVVQPLWLSRLRAVSLAAWETIQRA
ncbi:tri1 [Symbiodinium necroappetens]|uniref:Tri1 protein n=1 Tax=Symbiodinium necroappetens TaxID=1628268 RepID=A0A812L046_9DINO|nr:tri1 [Symbiodinium necroappetens]